jgi:hypothetical protein
VVCRRRRGGQGGRPPCSGHAAHGPRTAPNPAQLNATAAEHEFHRIRGAVGSFGFARCAAHLLILEKSWAQLDEARRNQELQAAYSAFTAGLQALIARFPHLAV